MARGIDGASRRRALTSLNLPTLSCLRYVPNYLTCNHLGNENSAVLARQQRKGKTWTLATGKPQWPVDECRRCNSNSELEQNVFDAASQVCRQSCLRSSKLLAVGIDMPAVAALLTRRCDVDDHASRRYEKSSGSVPWYSSRRPPGAQQYHVPSFATSFTCPPVIVTHCLTASTPSILQQQKVSNGITIASPRPISNNQHGSIPDTRPVSGRFSQRDQDSFPQTVSAVPS